MKEYNNWLMGKLKGQIIYKSKDRFKQKSSIKKMKSFKINAQGIGAAIGLKKLYQQCYFEGVS